MSITQGSIGQVALNLSEVVRELTSTPTDQTRENLAVVVNEFERIAALVSNNQTANVDQEVSWFAWKNSILGCILKAMSKLLPHPVLQRDISIIQVVST